MYNPSSLPRIKIIVLVGSVGKTSFDLVLSGDIASKFSEGYKQTLREEGPPASPHPANFVYGGGRFDDYEFALTLFPGCMDGNKVLMTGRDIVQTANYLANLSKPLFLGGQATSSPLCEVSIGANGSSWWRAKGYFSSSNVSFRGGYDKSGHPTIVDVSLSFTRHFGEYTSAASREVLNSKVLCYVYTFSTG